ncbi:MAG: site-specific DNA-methyltransferase [Clostridia bacterium]|nr:site-specific DNA-methyltransferase [Clostridia bacterium]
METTNLSKIKRDKMLHTINEIKKNITDEETLNNLSLIENELTKKKYGLIWEEHEERVDKELETQIPTFEEVKDKEIVSNYDDKFNFLLEGDNLHSLYLLEKTHKNKIDVIYIDPPYNTGNNDFTYGDEILSRDDEFKHSKWLSFMEKRLNIAKKLLNDTGVIFVSIDDNEMFGLKLLMDDIFGESNYQATITYVRKTSGKQDSTNFAKSTEYILVYSKTDKWICNKLEADERVTDRYNKKDSNGKAYREVDLRKTGTGDSREDRPAMFYPFYYNELTKDFIVSNIEKNEYKENGYIEILPIKSDGSEGRWRWGYETAQKNLNILIPKIMPKYKNEKKYTVYEMDYIDKKEDVRTVKEHTSWDRKEFNSDNAITDFTKLGFSNKDFSFPKSVELIKHIIRLSTNENSLILDFFAGSGTTGQAVEEYNKEFGGNRHFILCTNNENNICEKITYNRLLKTHKGITNDRQIDFNLKYYKTSYIPRMNNDESNLHDNLLINIKNLIQLENGIEIDNKKIRIYLNESELDEFSINEKELSICDKIYISSDILLTSEQEKTFEDNNIEVYVIPEYYFEDEIMEVA